MWINIGAIGQANLLNHFKNADRAMIAQVLQNYPAYDQTLANFFSEKQFDGLLDAVKEALSVDSPAGGCDPYWAILACWCTFGLCFCPWLSAKNNLRSFDQRAHEAVQAAAKTVGLNARLKINMNPAVGRRHLVPDDRDGECKWKDAVGNPLVFRKHAMRYRNQEARRQGSQQPKVDCISWVAGGPPWGYSVVVTLAAPPPYWPVRGPVARAAYAASFKQGRIRLEEPGLMAFQGVSEEKVDRCVASIIGDADGNITKAEAYKIFAGVNQHPWMNEPEIVRNDPELESLEEEEKEEKRKRKQSGNWSHPRKSQDREVVESTKWKDGFRKRAEWTDVCGKPKHGIKVTLLEIFEDELATEAELDEIITALTKNKGAFPC